MILSDLREAFAENIFAKPCRVAVEGLRRATDPTEASFPEYCPQTGSEYGQYIFREAEFWTCGFFPGTLYALLERSIRFPQSLSFHSSARQPASIAQIRAHLLRLCQAWSSPLHAMAARTDTHDLGFIIMPALRVDWELTCNERSLASIVRAAQSLASRYVPSARAIRSWDLVRRLDMEIVGLEDNLLVIIDSMCNLDLLFYASAHSGERRLAEIATAHARTVLTTHLRPEGPPLAKCPERATTGVGSRYTGQLFSTCHVANLDPRTGKLQRRATAQGYADDSTWARGQAWAILGYAQTYMWTGQREFLDAACGCAEYFLQRLETAPAFVDVVIGGEDQDTDGSQGTRKRGRYVPLWDFDAPIEDVSNPTRDSSAGVIAANGMLVLSQALAGVEQGELSAWFRNAAVTIERALTRRAIIVLKEQIIWSCAKSRWTEETCCESPLARVNWFALHGSEYFLNSSVRDWFVFDDESDQLWSRLRRLILDYTNRKLTVQRDAFDAFSSILQQVKEKEGEHFLWGIPATRFELGLLDPPVDMTPLFAAKTALEDAHLKHQRTITDADGNVVGQTAGCTAVSEDEGRESGECEFVLIASNSPPKHDKQKFVMQIRRRGGIAYRVNVADIRADAWDAANPVRTLVALG
ncbi:hypothetical protein NEMBOFW57_004758 [Staphylotrichum longicolle]|uniref:Uncharacterized protein n=1 Tax=Staphylotrichum longicolle TaxID=669026 RepID=A0AAD4F8M4_9PEZI|nr:hypothetical protein NEMBOFW57_004758 [Staphylotrichum longicolle]